MERSVSRIATIVDNVLDFARGVSGTLVSDFRPGSLEAALEAIIAEHEALHPARRINRLMAGSYPVEADHERIAQLFANLLSNALNHGAAEGYIRVGVEHAPGEVTVWVANQGVPIPPEAMPRLFDPFKRNASSGNGLGLGLYIASEIAKAHGGTIEVQSSVEETRFTLHLPLREKNI